MSFRTFPDPSSQPASRLSGGPWAGRGVKLLGLFATAWLVLLHLDLLRERITDRSILTPEVALEWGAAVLLLGALAALRRAGVPLFRGRKALVVWTLVLLLHASSGLPVAAELASNLAGATESGLLLVLPLVAAVVTVLQLGGRWRLGRRGSGAFQQRLRTRSLSLSPRFALAPGFARVVSGRPPPR